MMKIIKWLRNKKMARKIANTPKNKIWEIFHKLWKNPEEVQELQTLMHLQGQRGNVSSVFKNFQAAKNNKKRKAYIQDDQNLEEDQKEEELVLQKKYPNQDTPIPKELELIPDSGPLTDNDTHMYNEYYKIPNYQNKYHTEDLLVIGRSKIPGAGLGLFAFVPLETRMLPENKQKWIKIDKKLRSSTKSLATNKYGVFKGTTPLSKIST
jgi:hypothetical protein